MPLVVKNKFISFWVCFVQFLSQLLLKNCSILLSIINIIGKFMFEDTQKGAKRLCDMICGVWGINYNSIIYFV